jgi:hypothetical protein
MQLRLVLRTALSTAQLSQAGYRIHGSMIFCAAKSRENPEISLDILWRLRARISTIPHNVPSGVRVFLRCDLWYATCLGRKEVRS